MTQILPETERPSPTGRAVNVLPAINPATNPVIEVRGGGSTYLISGPDFDDLTPRQRDYIAEGVQARIDELTAEFARRRASHPGDTTPDESVRLTAGPAEDPDVSQSRAVSETGPVRAQETP